MTVSHGGAAGGSAARGEPAEGVLLKTPLQAVAPARDDITPYAQNLARI